MRELPLLAIASEALIEHEANQLLGKPATKPKFPPNRWANVFAQLVGPLITEITCLRSHGLKVFHLVSAHVGSPPGGTTD